MSGLLDLKTAEVFEPLLVPSRYKAAYGGRGSGKSWFFAGLMLERHILEPGLKSICVREVQRDLKESAKLLIEQMIKEHGLEGQGFRILRDQIEAPGGGLIIFRGMTDHSSASVKSLEGFGIAWVEEAQTLSAKSLSDLTPTLRKKGSEVWFSWNPTRKSDPVDKFFRSGEKPSDAIIVKANWKDNPWFKDTTMVQERLDCLRMTPDQYPHIWEGEYATVLTGAYYAEALRLAREQKRIGKVAPDPLMTYRAFWDIGGTGAKADATAIWIVQFVGREIRVLDYYEAKGQPLAAHVNWLREKKYDRALMVLPHDGAAHDKVYVATYQGALQQAGFDVEIVPNQGAGAAKMRIEATRRLFPSIWFNEDTTQGGLDALGWYHAKLDDKRDIDLGPDHDWSSHAADAFGMMCMAYEAPRDAIKKRPQVHAGAGNWMG